MHVVPMLPANYPRLSRSERRYVREEYVRRQNGLCAHCKAPLSGPARSDILEKPINHRLFPENFLQHPVHLHHCHHTGLTIGAVHSHCNAVLWQYHGE